MSVLKVDTLGTVQRIGERRGEITKQFTDPIIGEGVGTNAFTLLLLLSSSLVLNNSSMIFGPEHDAKMYIIHKIRSTVRMRHIYPHNGRDEVSLPLTPCLYYSLN